MIQNPDSTVPVQKNEGSGFQMTVGKTVFNVNVHFGKVPLDDILRQRILRETALRT